MMELWNTMKSAGLASATQLGQNRWGIITAVKQSNSGYEAKIMLQPEQVPSGWLPVLSHSVGAGWGLVSPPEPGMQAFVASDTGDGHHGVIVGMSYSLQAMPPVPPNGFAQPNGTPVQAGEFCLVSKAGAVFRLCADGSIHIKGEVRIDGGVTIQGDLNVQASQSGAVGNINGAADIAAAQDIRAGRNIYDVHGLLDSIRQIFNAHRHGTSAGPTPTIPE